MTTLDPARYFTDQSLTADFNGPVIFMNHMRRLGFTVEWGAVASTAGDFRLEVSDDPRVEQDVIRGTNTATWIERTIPAAAFDGTNCTLNGKSITIGATAGSFALNVDLPEPYARLKYVYSAGGATNQAQARRSAGP